MSRRTISLCAQRQPSGWQPGVLARGARDNRIPWHGPDHFFKKWNSFRRMSGTNQHGRRRFLGFKRTADNERHPSQQDDAAVNIPGLNPNISESDHVGNSKIVVLYLPAKDKLQQFA